MCFGFLIDLRKRSKEKGREIETLIFLQASRFGYLQITKFISISTATVLAKGGKPCQI